MHGQKPKLKQSSLNHLLLKFQTSLIKNKEITDVAIEEEELTMVEGVEVADLKIIDSKIIMRTAILMLGQI